MYHGFTDKAEHEGIENYQGKHLNIGVFRSQLEYLKKYYNVISLNKAVEHYTKDIPIPDNSVVITIDDGYRSNYALAYPILKEYGAPATVFLTTDFVGKKEFLWADRVEYAINRTRADNLKLLIGDKRYSFNLSDNNLKIASERKIRSLLKSKDYKTRDRIIKKLEENLGQRLPQDRETPEEYRPLEWNEAAEMAGSGIISIGSHTQKHAILTRLKTEDAKEELSSSKKSVEEKTSMECMLFCYPNGEVGDFSDRTKTLLKESGYSCGLTNVAGMNDKRSDIFELKRYGMSSQVDSIEFAMLLAGVARLPGLIRQSLLCIANNKNAQEERMIESFDKESRVYSDWYSGNTSMAHSFTIRRQRVYELLRGSKRGRVLDIGCGPGVMVERLVNDGFEFFGVDISEGMIQECRERFGRVKSAHFSVGRIEKLDFPDAYFDAIICMGVVEYIDDDAAAVKEMARVLKPGGRAIITLPNKLSPYRIWDRIILRRPITSLAKRLIRYKKKSTLIHREYTERSYSNLLASERLNATDIIYYNFKLMLFPFDILLPRLTVSLSRRLERLSRGRLKFLGTGFIVKADKVQI